MPAPLELVAFDIDGTLIRGPEGMTVWEVLNRRFAGSAAINRERYASYLAGKISYAEWVDLDIRGWQDAGATREDLLHEFRALSLVPGAREALAALRERGLRLVAISGTLDAMLEAVFPDHPFEELHANHLAFDAAGRISHWRATPFDMAGKAQALRAIAMRDGIPREHCAFVGDSSNDVWIAREAGLAIAFNPRSEELERVSHVIVRDDDLRALLPHLLPGDPLEPR